MVIDVSGLAAEARRVTWMAVTQTAPTPGDGPQPPEALTPEVLDEIPADAEAGEQVARPTKLIRIASMVRTLLDEARRAPLDDAGRRALKEIHERSIHELEEILSPDLRQELEEVTLPFTQRHAERVASCASRRRSSSAGSKGSSTGSRPRCSPSRCRRSGSSKRCAAAESARARPGRPRRATRRSPVARRVPLGRAMSAPRAVTEPELGAVVVALASRPRSSPTGPTPARSTPRSSSCARCRRSCSRARRAR